MSEPLCGHLESGMRCGMRARGRQLGLVRWELCEDVLEWDVRAGGLLLGV